MLPAVTELLLQFRRLAGEQAPRYEYIVDDAGPGFSTTGEWAFATLDSGEWQATGPFFHDWGEGCRLATAPGSEARWELTVPETDTYTLTVWWPAAPEASQWSGDAVFEVFSGG